MISGKSGWRLGRGGNRGREGCRSEAGRCRRAWFEFWAWVWVAHLTPLKPSFSDDSSSKLPVDAGAVTRSNTKAKNGRGR